jgi:hypothetical protein
MPRGLALDDGKRSDVIILIPWQSGHSATSPYELASYSFLSATGAVNAAEIAAARKFKKPSALSESYHFFIVAIKTFHPLSFCNPIFLKGIERHITLRTLDLRDSASTFLLQRISVELSHEFPNKHLLIFVRFFFSVVFVDNEDDGEGENEDDGTSPRGQKQAPLTLFAWPWFVLVD